MAYPKDFPHHSGKIPSEKPGGEQGPRVTGPGGNQLRNSEFFGIHIDHIPTGQSVSFEGWVTQFSDTYTSQWSEEMAYGRMDPLSVFQSTRRSITLGFDIVNDSKDLALQNMNRVRRLIQFLYPSYQGGNLSQQNVMTAGPLLALKWTNLISSPQGNNEGEKLIGYINGALNYSPEVEEGGFLVGALKDGDNREIRNPTGIKNFFPKKLSLNFSFTVLHTHLVGWAPAGGSGTTFVFGGDRRIGASFPNAYLEPPPPPAPAPKPAPPEEETALRPGEEDTFIQRDDAAADAATVAALGDDDAEDQEEEAREQRERRERDQRTSDVALANARSQTHSRGPGTLDAQEQIDKYDNQEEWLRSIGAIK